MPTCAVLGCRSRSGSGMPERKFFRFPTLNKRSNELLEKSKTRQNAWLEALRRRDFLPHQCTNARLCDLHFVSGQSARLHDVDNPDWVPTINLGYKTKPQRFNYKQVNPQFSSTTDVQIAHFISGMTAKLQDVTNPDWKAALKPSNDDSNAISDESDSSQLLGSVDIDTLAYGYNGVAERSLDDNDHNYSKQPTLSRSEDSIKSAVVFRNKNGQFSFLCIHCNTFSDNCDKMIDHIDSHFDSTDLITHMDFEMLESPEVLPEPEFISCNSPAEIKVEPELEITNNETVCELTNKMLQWKPANESDGLKIKSEVLTDSEELGLGDQYTGDAFKSSNAVLHTKQTNPPRSPNSCQPECGGDPKSSFTFPNVLRKPILSNQIKMKDVTDISNVRLPILRIMETNSPRLSDKYKLLYDDDPNSGRKRLNTVQSVPPSSSDKYQLKYEKDLKSFLTLSKDLRKPTTSSNQLRLIKPKPVTMNVESAASNVRLPKCRISTPLIMTDESTGTIVRAPKLRIIDTNSPRPRDKYQLIYNESVSEIYHAKLPVRPLYDLSKPNQTKTNCSDCDMYPQVTNECDPRRHKCIDCNAWFSNHFDYRTHLEEMHEKGIPAIRCYQCEMEPPVTNKSDPRRHKCLFCKEWFSNHIDFKAHFKDVHNQDSDKFFSVLTNCYEFSCYICEKDFALRDYLSNHMKIHHDKFLEHQCPKCGIRLRTYGALTQHMKNHEDVTYKCSECKKVFSYYANLRKHLWCHKTDLNYVCDLCSKGFKMLKYLKRHMAVHNEAKIYCRFCDASFKFSTGRRIHEKNVHKVL